MPTTNTFKLHLNSILSINRLYKPYRVFVAHYLVRTILHPPIVALDRPYMHTRIYAHAIFYASLDNTKAIRSRVFPIYSLPPSHVIARNTSFAQRSQRRHISRNFCGVFNVFYREIDKGSTAPAICKGGSKKKGFFHK